MRRVSIYWFPSTAIIMRSTLSRKSRKTLTPPPKGFSFLEKAAAAAASKQLEEDGLDINTSTSTQLHLPNPSSSFHARMGIGVIGQQQQQQQRSSKLVALSVGGSGSGADKAGRINSPHSATNDNENSGEVEETSAAAPPATIPAPIDSNEGLNAKAVFRKYLTKSGFKHSIIRAIVSLYEEDEKPDDPLAWILDFIGRGIPTLQHLNNFKSEVEDLRAKVEALQEENYALKQKIEERDEAQRPDEWEMYRLEWQRLIDELTEQGDFAPKSFVPTSSGGVTINIVGDLDGGVEGEE